MLFKNCMVAAALSVGIATASFALMASDAPFGVAELSCSVSVESSADAPAQFTGPKGDGSTCNGVTDCNGNGVDDRCDIDCSDVGTYCVQGSPAIDDCDGTHFSSCGTSVDCNGNGIPDECEGVECCSNSDCAFMECCGHISPNTCGGCTG